MVDGLSPYRRFRSRRYEFTVSSSQVAHHGSSELSTDISFTHELVVPGVWRAFVDKDVHAALDSDLERRREVNGAPEARATFAPDEHPIASFHGAQSCIAHHADQAVRR